MMIKTLIDHRYEMIVTINQIICSLLDQGHPSPSSAFEVTPQLQHLQACFELQTFRQHSLYHHEKIIF